MDGGREGEHDGAFIRQLEAYSILSVQSGQVGIGSSCVPSNCVDKGMDKSPSSHRAPRLMRMDEKFPQQPE